MQQGIPTVGDTLTVVHRIMAPAGAVIDARPPADSSVATLASPPVVMREGDSVSIAYTLEVWAPGHSDLVVPGAIVVDTHGRIDTLPDAHIMLNVASVLPAAKTTMTIAPRTAQPWVPRAERSPLPFVVLLPLAMLLIIGLQWWARRLGPSFTPGGRRTGSIDLTADRVNGWLAAGEGRLVLDHIEWTVRHRDDFADWRARSAAIRFAAGDEAAVTELATEGWLHLVAPPPDRQGNATVNGSPDDASRPG